jgi:phosphoglycolate phosphatase
MWKHVRAVLFDLDGTLIDSALIWELQQTRCVWIAACRRCRSMPTAIWRGWARGMLGIAFGMTPESAGFAEMREEFFRNYEQCMTERTYAFDGVPELIRALEAGPFCGGGDQQVHALHRAVDPSDALVCSGCGRGERGHDAAFQASPRASV